VTSTNNVVDQFPARVATATPTFDPLNVFINTQPDARTPYAQLFSLSFQRELFRDYQLEVGYSGSRSLDQVRQLETNPSSLTASSDRRRTGTPDNPQHPEPSR
jgi:hypothetical protein